MENIELNFHVPGACASSAVQSAILLSANRRNWQRVLRVLAHVELGFIVCIGVSHRQYSPHRCFSVAMQTFASLHACIAYQDVTPPLKHCLALVDGSENCHSSCRIHQRYYFGFCLEEYRNRQQKQQRIGILK
jgi:hypothetical protein